MSKKEQPKRYTGFAWKVGRIAKLKAKISKYEKDRDALIAELKKNGVGIYEGTLVDANVFESTRSALDLKSMVSDGILTKEQIDKYTKEGDPFLTCKIQGKANG